MTQLTHDAAPAEAVSGTPPFSHPEAMAAWMRASVQIVTVAAKVMARDIG